MRVFFLFKSSAEVYLPKAGKPQSYYFCRLGLLFKKLIKD